MNKNIENFLLSAKSKALATYGLSGINVVPVSSIRIENGKIWLINYFMEKTKENVVNNKKVSLTVWTDMMGYQIKGEVEYLEKGELFDRAVEWVKESLPDRVVKGLLIITPESIIDISPTKDTEEKFLAK